MNKIISVFLSLILVIFNFEVVAQTTATLLPDAVQQYFDNNGNPLSSGKVYFYIPSTTTNKTVWQDAAEVTPWVNPVPLNAAGRPNGDQAIYGSGIYRQILKDKNNNTIWDRVTTSTGSGGSTPSAVGDGNLVGTILPWSGLIAPNQYVFGYGQEILRSGFPDFYTAVTQNINVICTASSNTLTGVADTTQIKIGSPVELNLCVVPGTTVVSKTSSTIVLSNPSTISINSVATFFPFGNGNGSTTFNVPDLRGQVIAGRNNMGGTDSSALTSSFCAVSGLGVNCGSQSHTLTEAELPALTKNATLLTPGVAAIGYNIFAAGAGGNNVLGVPFSAPPGANNQNIGFTNPTYATTFGGGAAHSIVQPTIQLNYIVKVLPDTSTSIATGVFSIGGMTGVIACGTGLLCTGNIISVTGAIPGAGVTGNLAYYTSSSTIGGNQNANISSGALTLGVATSVQGQLKLAASTSGTATITTQAASGSPTLTLGTSSGTPAVTASSPLVINSTTGNIACATCVTSSGGGAITGVTPVAVSAAGAVSITGAAGQILAGATPAFTSTPILGASGTLGSLGFGNATSGIATLQPVAGALGTITISIPSAAGTMAVNASSPLVLNATTGNLTCPTCATSSGGGAITGTAPIAVSAAGVVSITGLAGGILNGSTPAFTVTPTLGVAGSTLGTLSFANVTSGTITLSPVAGALLSSVLTLPAATDTVAVLAATQAFTNKTYNGLTITSSTGTLTITNAKTFGVTASITLGGTDSTTMTFPTTNATIARTDAGQTFTGTNAFGIITATSLNGNIFTTGTYTLTGTASKTLTFNNSITLAGTDATTWTGPSTNATLATLNITSQTVTGGFINTSVSLGTFTSGTFTINCGTNQLQFYTNGGAHTLAAPANDSQCIIRVLNNGSAGTITFSGFTVGSNTGDTINTTNGNAFAIQVWRINGVSRYLVSAYQ